MPLSKPLPLLSILILAGCGQSETPTIKDPDVERQVRIATHANSWPASPNYTQTFSALDPTLRLSGRQSTSLFDASDEYWGLPRTEGYDLVDAYCSVCHTLQIVMQQSATPERWDYMLDWMVAEQGMAPIYEEDRPIVHTYLSKHFGAQTE